VLCMEASKWQNTFRFFFSFPIFPAVTFSQAVARVISPGLPPEPNMPSGSTASVSLVQQLEGGGYRSLIAATAASVAPAPNWWLYGKNVTIPPMVQYLLPSLGRQICRIPTLWSNAEAAQVLCQLTSTLQQGWSTSRAQPWRFLPRDGLHRLCCKAAAPLDVASVCLRSLTVPSDCMVVMAAGGWQF
jgi:hypothetical protein